MAQPTPRKFECTVPQCGKLFTRKEHLTRHLKTHNPQPQYQCPICGRRYGRSDVLKRHVEFHPQYTRARLNALPSPGTDVEPSPTPCTENATANLTEASSDLLETQDTGPITELLSPSAPGARAHEVLSAEDCRLSPWHQSQEPSSSGLLGFPSHGMDVQSPSQWTPSFNLSMEGDAAPKVPHSRSILLKPSIVDRQPRRTVGARNTATLRTGRAVGPDSTIISIGSPTSSIVSTLGQNLPTTRRPLVDRNSPCTKRLIQVYFDEVHPQWPLLHEPTFDVNGVSDVLLASMVMLASWLQDGEDHTALAPVVFNEVMMAHVQLNASLHTIQSLLLCVIYCIYSLNLDGMRTKALQLTGILFSACRYLDLFTGQHQSPDAALDESAFAQWLAEEQLRRVAYGALRVDAFLSILTDHPTCVRFHEISIPLPKTSETWQASSEDERRKLQWIEPAGRQRAPFCFLIRDVLDLDRHPDLPYRGTIDDYHLILVALQSGAWDAARDAHGFSADGLATKLNPGTQITLWAVHLSMWRHAVEKDHAMGMKYWSQPPGSGTFTIVPLTLTLYHASILKMCAPLRLLRTPSNFVGRGWSDPLSTQHPRSKLRTWMYSGCCRESTWQGAQVGRVLEHEIGTNTTASSRLKMNPLIFPAVLMGAVASCFYAYHVRACAACTGKRVTETIDLFAAQLGDADLSTWMKTGQGVAIWGPSEIIVCHCSVVSLAQWFRKLLAKDVTAKGEFEAFLVELGATAHDSDRTSD